MKKISIVFTVLSASFIMYSCNGNDSTKTDSTTTSSDSAGSGTTSTTSATTPATDTSNAAKSMTDTSNAKMSSQKPDKDATDFVMKAASGGMMEVELGKVAQDKAKSQRVKDFGSMMVTDHTQANDELKSIASSKNITIPAAVMPDDQKHIDMLKAKSGAAFDKAYTSMMVDDHKKDIAEFKKTSEKSTDPDIKNFATKTLPVLQKHLDSIQAIHSNM